jgi:hypothetical protein
MEHVTDSLTPATDAARAITGRSCGDCALCCKILDIVALEKPAGEWCKHCSTHKKCDLYPIRPAAICDTFNCGYITQPGVPESWFPGKSRMILNTSADGQHVFIAVDPARPDAWRKAPYYQHIKQWALANNGTGKQIIVSINKRYIVVFPDREVDLGAVGDDETVTFTVTQTPSGPYTEAQKKKIAP